VETIMSEGTENAATSGDWDKRVQDAYNGVESAAERARGRLAQAAGQLEATYRRASEDAAKAMQEAQKQLQQRYTELEARIRQDPVTGVGIGVLIGVVMTLMLSSGPRTIVIRERGRRL
jgi:ElaB/YqjD/DUF883 family membrane-anchored ribosome-binding protein